MIRELKSVRFWFALLVATGFLILLGIVFSWDADVLAWQESLSKPVRAAADKISDFGDWPYLMAIGAALLFLSIHKKFCAMRQMVVCMMLASTLAGAAANVVKSVSGRARPHTKHVEQGWHGPFYRHQLTMGNNRLASFPSGHSAAAVGFFGYLLLLRMPASLIGILLLGIVPAARIVSGAHFLSDVLAGSALGMLAAIYVHFALRDTLVAWIIAHSPLRLSARPPQTGQSEIV